MTLVVNSNSRIGQGWPNYLKQSGNRPAAAEPVLRFCPTDFAAVARQFGLKGIHGERPQDLAAALAEVPASDETCVGHDVADIDGRAPEPWTCKEEH